MTKETAMVTSGTVSQFVFVMKALPLFSQVSCPKDVGEIGAGNIE